MAGLVVAAGGIAAAYASAAVGLGVFGAVASSVLSQASDAAKNYTKAQQAAAQATDPAKKAAALQAEKQALFGLDSAQKSVVFSIIKAQDAWHGFTKAATPGVAKVLAAAVKLLPDAFRLLKPFLAPVENALIGIIGSMKAGIAPGSQFSKIMHDFAARSGTTLSLALRTAGHLFMGLLGVMHAFLPTGTSLIAWVEKASEKFQAWGTTLSSHSGFQSLMATFKTETPLAVQVLKNLGTVILNVGKAMTGLAGVGNSKSLLQLLIPLSGVLASLSKNTALDRLVLYLIAATSAANKLGPAFTSVKTAAVFFPGLWKDIVKFAAVTEGATAAEVIAAAATRAWGIAMAALPWVALAAAVVAVAVLIIKYHTQIWNFMKRVWNDILGVIMAVWHWIQGNWPLLLAIITGPVGLAIRWIVQNFSSITGAVKNVLSAISTAWNATWNTLKGAFRSLVVDYILTPLGWIITAAAKAFGWVPGLGGKLKDAAKAFTDFKNNVNAALGGLNNKTINVSVAMTAATNPYGGINPKAARGMYIATGKRGVDDQLILAQRGELVVPTKMVAAGEVDHLRGRIPGFASGGTVGGVNVKATAPGLTVIAGRLQASVEKLAVAFAKANMTGSSAIVNDARSWLGKIPYVWGGTAVPGGADCSGFVQTIYGRHHISAPRTSEAQGAWVKRSGPVPGGLAFYHSPAGGADPGHVAIVQNASSVISQGGGMGPVIEALRFMPLLWTGVPPKGFDSGGWLMPGTTLAVNNTGRPERVTPPGGDDAMLDELRALRAELRQLTGVAAAIPASTGRHVAGAVGGAGADAAFRRRYPGR